MRIRIMALLAIGSLVVLSVVAYQWHSSLDSRSIRADAVNTADLIVATAALGSDDSQASDDEADAVRTSEKGSEEKGTPPILGHFRGRTHTITIHVSSGGPRFTVATSDGRVLAEALTASEIEAKHPEIYKLYKSTFAQSNSYLDASLPE